MQHKAERRTWGYIVDGHISAIERPDGAFNLYQDGKNFATVSKSKIKEWLKNGAKRSTRVA